MDQEVPSAEPKRIAVTQHLDALHMYDAAYHQRRQLDEAPIDDVVPAHVKPRLVSWGVYLWTTAHNATFKTITRSRRVFTVVLIGLIALNVASNLWDVNATNPTHVEESGVMFIKNGYSASYNHYSSIYHHNTAYNQQYRFEYGTREYVTSTPLPPDWLAANLVTYIGLLVMMSIFRRAGRESTRRGQGIIPVLPATRANILHLTAEESLVRASAMPADVQPGILLRAATYQTETPIEQLVRPSGLAE